MLAVFITKAGGPGAVQVADTSPPEPKTGQLLIKVQAAGINYADIVARTGLYPDAPKFPFMPGYEFAGTVEKATEDSSFGEGERVFGLSLFGAQAEFVAVAEKQLFRIPDSISFEQAAAIPVNYLTAYYALFRLGNLQEHEKILIHSCAGGVGTAAVQLAKTRKAEIFGTTSTAEKVDYLEKIGVDHPINYRQTDFSRKVTETAGKACLDLVLDPVGGETFKKSFRLLAPGGRIICYGVADLVAGGRKNIFRLLWKLASNPRITTLKLMQQNKSVSGLALNRLLNRVDYIRKAMNEIIDFFNQGLIKPEISRAYEINEIAEAHEFLESGRSRGKLILKINKR